MIARFRVEPARVTYTLALPRLILLLCITQTPFIPLYNLICSIVDERRLCGLEMSCILGYDTTWEFISARIASLVWRMPFLIHRVGFRSRAVLASCIDMFRMLHHSHRKKARGRHD